MECRSIEHLQTRVLKLKTSTAALQPHQILRKTQKYKIITDYEIRRFRDHYHEKTEKEISDAVNRALHKEAKKQGNKSTQQ